MNTEKHKRKSIKKKTSPTQRSLKWLREVPYHAAVVERWNHFAKIRQDLFGWIDIVAIDPDGGIIGVQTTIKSEMPRRLLKAWGNAALVDWLKSGNRLSIHGWHKVKGHWEMSHRPVTMADLTGQLPPQIVPNVE